MPSNQLAVEARKLSKSYRIKHKGAEAETFWALRDFDLELPPGQILGIIGRNGAGKSTLLKILSRITRPTSGEAFIRGRVGSLLEVGTGFHEELSARENIYLNGSILGMRRKEIDAHFDEIVDFAGCERFLDTPVKRFSSGMYARLAFGIAAHLETDVLVIDEVLAVGDAEFQRKCLGKMKDASNEGRTVLFVSHSINLISMLCDRCVVLNRGQKIHDGDVEEAVALYYGLAQNPDPAALAKREGSGEFRSIDVRADKEIYNADEAKTFRFKLQQHKPMQDKMFLKAFIRDSMGHIVVQCDGRLLEQWFHPTDGQEVEFTLRSPWLKPGPYSLDVWVTKLGMRVDVNEAAAFFTVVHADAYPGIADEEATDEAPTLADFNFQI